MAKLAHRAETEWVGLARGDFRRVERGDGPGGRGGLVDAKDLSVQPIPFPKTAGVVVMDTGQRVDVGELVAIISDRLEANKAAVKSYKVSSLRDLSMSRFEKDADNLDEHVMHYARHVMTENSRTILAAEMLRSDALATIGRMMSDSHDSLIEDYQVQSDAIEKMVMCAMKQPNVFGARGTGYSIGGAAVALVRDFSADTMSKLVTTCYKKETGDEPEAYVVEPVAGVEVV